MLPTIGLARGTRHAGIKFHQSRAACDFLLRLPYTSASVFYFLFSKSELLVDKPNGFCSHCGLGGGLGGGLFCCRICGPCTWEAECKSDVVLFAALSMRHAVSVFSSLLLHVCCSLVSLVRDIITRPVHKTCTPDSLLHREAVKASRVLFPVLNTARIPSPLLLLPRILHSQDNTRNNI